MLSDDGMRIILNGDIAIERDGVHAPRWDCSGKISFTEGEKKMIRVEYFQGPRTQISMELLMASL